MKNIAATVVLSLVALLLLAGLARVVSGDPLPRSAEAVVPVPRDKPALKKPPSQPIEISPARACGPAPAVAAELARRHRERIVMRGLNAGGAVLSVWLNERSGTFTLTLRIPRGVTCIIASGTDGALLRATPGQTL